MVNNNLVVDHNPDHQSVDRIHIDRHYNNHLHFDYQMMELRLVVEYINNFSGPIRRRLKILFGLSFKNVV